MTPNAACIVHPKRWSHERADPRRLLPLLHGRPLRRLLQTGAVPHARRSHPSHSRSHLAPRSTPLKAVFPSIARRIRVSARRVAAIWHREARNIYASEMDDLRDLVAKCINADIERLEADLAVALASSNRVDAPEVFAAKAAVENAKTILKGIK
jgi:hypothetical protein